MYLSTPERVICPVISPRHQSHCRNGGGGGGGCGGCGGCCCFLPFFFPFFGLRGLGISSCSQYRFDYESLRLSIQRPTEYSTMPNKQRKKTRGKTFTPTRKSSTPTAPPKEFDGDAVELLAIQRNYPRIYHPRCPTNAHMEAQRYGIPYNDVRIKTDTCYSNNECYCLKHWIRFHGDEAINGLCTFQTRENATEGALCSKAEHCISYTHPIDGCSHNRMHKACPWWYHGIQFH
jgi:hypothetical protein